MKVGVPGSQAPKGSRTLPALAALFVKLETGSTAPAATYRVVTGSKTVPPEGEEYSPDLRAQMSPGLAYHHQR